MILRGILRRIFIALLSLCLLLINNELKAQEKTVTAGFQFKPIFSSKFFNTGPETQTVKGVDFTVSPKGGYSMGMVLRRGFTNTISLETGINYVKRKYELSVKDSSRKTNGNFSMVSYDIPILGLVFIQLSEKVFMDVGLGFSIDFYPSDLKTKNEFYEHYSARQSWVSPAVLANLGWEYRTEKSGYLYFGASYHRPFNDIYGSYIGSPDLKATNPVQTSPAIALSGNFLTVDFRYFFHSDPLKKRAKVRKNN